MTADLSPPLMAHHVHFAATRCESKKEITIDIDIGLRSASWLSSACRMTADLSPPLMAHHVHFAAARCEFRKEIAIGIDTFDIIGGVTGGSPEFQELGNYTNRLPNHKPDQIQHPTSLPELAMRSREASQRYQAAFQQRPIHG